MPDPGARRPHRRPARTAGRPLPDGPATVPDWEGAGWTESARRHAVRVADVERVRRGVLAPAVDRPAQAQSRARREAALVHAARAVTLSCPRAVISHRAAAATLGLPVLGRIGLPCVTVPSGTALRRLADAHLHRAALPDADVFDVAGYRVTSPARTVLDIAREHGAEAGVVAADHALHRGLADDASLAAALEVCVGWPGRAAARATMLLADGLAESPLESLSRLRIMAAGLPTPRLQPDICDEHGRFVARCDFYWDEFGVVGEADGDLKYDAGRDAIVRERSRERDLVDTGLIVVRWSWSDLARFAAVAARLRIGFDRGARRGDPERRWGVITRPAQAPLHPYPSLTARIGTR